MLNWFGRRERIENWENEAKSRNALFFMVIFDSIDKSEYPVYDKISMNCAEAILKAAPIHSLKYVTEIFDLREKKYKKPLRKCDNCGKMNEM